MEEIALEAFVRLNALRAGWHEVEPGEEVRDAAKRFLRVPDLRTADARPSTLELISLDDRLVAAARREGFPATKLRA